MIFTTFISQEFFFYGNDEDFLIVKAKGIDSKTHKVHVVCRDLEKWMSDLGLSQDFNPASDNIESYDYLVEYPAYRQCVINFINQRNEPIFITSDFKNETVEIY